MMEYQPSRVVEEGIDGAVVGVIYVVYRKNERREKGSKKKKRNRDNGCGSPAEIARTQIWVIRW